MHDMIRACRVSACFARDAIGLHEAEAWLNSATRAYRKKVYWYMKRTKFAPHSQSCEESSLLAHAHHIVSTRRRRYSVSE